MFVRCCFIASGPTSTLIFKILQNDPQSSIRGMLIEDTNMLQSVIRIQVKHVCKMLLYRIRSHFDLNFQNLTKCKPLKKVKLTFKIFKLNNTQMVGSKLLTGIRICQNNLVPDPQHCLLNKDTYPTGKLAMEKT